jgi:hypothetical protein
VLIREHRSSTAVSSRSIQSELRSRARAHPAPKARVFLRVATLLLLASASAACGSRGPTSPQRRAPTATGVPPAAPASSGAKPAVLFASPRGVATLDLTYLNELRERGFEVDWTESLDELSAERLGQFNAAVLFVSPDAYQKAIGASAPPSRDDAFAAVLREYVERGGGVLLMPEETNLKAQRLSVLTDAWGARIPAERIVEEDAARRAELPRGSYRIPVAYTERIAPSPITRGVRGIWYPVSQAFEAAMTSPLILDGAWRVLVRASATARTEAINPAGGTHVAPGLIKRTEPELSPALFATRTIGEGRVALFAAWPQFSFVSGTKWLYDRVVLERGMKGKPSDLGRLLENTLRWLAEPSLRAGRFGGGASRRRALEPNADPRAKEPFKAIPVGYDESIPGTAELAAEQRVYRGLIGARTLFSGGRSTVEEYARAARGAGLDFVVFFEWLSELDEAELSELARKCRSLSGPDLLLLPGFTARSNLGNRLFFFGPSPAWPPASVLTGPDKRTIYVQEQNASGAFTGFPTHFFDWVLSAFHDGRQAQVGYFDFSSAPRGVRLHDARLYSMAGIRHYRNGKLLEDVFDDYLLTAAGTIAPTPVAVHELDSAAELARQANANRGLTFVVASSLLLDAATGVYQRGLRWKTPFESMSTYVSSGPQILAWPGVFRNFTYGSEGFSPERAVMAAPIVLRSERGLREFALYDGPRLFRRVALHGRKEVRQTLVLDGSLQRNLVLVAEDRAGGRAVSFARRSWSDGTAAPIFCGDHINDCIRTLLAHGPWSLRLSDPPLLPDHVAGLTWDGAPHATLSALGRQNVDAELTTADGAYSSFRLDPIPLLEFSDEGATGVTAWRRDAFDDDLISVLNAQSTHGPLSTKPPLFRSVQTYRQWLARSDGPPPYGWAAASVRLGGNASLFTQRLDFSRPAQISRLQWASFDRQPEVILAILPVRGSPTKIDLGDPGLKEVALNPGDAIAAVGKRAMNAHLLVNRGAPLRVIITDRVRLMAETPLVVTGAERPTFEMAALALPVDPPPQGPQDLAAILRYLRDPSSVTLNRGQRRMSPGLIDINADNGAIELQLPKVPFDGILPARVHGLNPRWSAGLLQLQGYAAGFYGSGENRYRALAVDAEGAAHLPLDASRTDLRLRAGHPISADGAGEELFVQVTCLGGQPFRWHISVNNPTGKIVRTTLRGTMEVPGLSFAEREVTLAPGELRVLQ